MSARPTSSTAMRAIAALSFACILWGLSFPVMQIAMQALSNAAAVHAPQVGDLALRTAFNALRFCIAGGIYAVLVTRHLRGLKASEARGGLAVGALFTIGLTLQIAGLRYCLPSVSGMLTCLSVIFTPFANGQRASSRSLES
jgi:drug/metabolite transporter (DMT)-like permease